MSNLNSLKKSELISRIEQLERNAYDDSRRIGIMMYDANVLSQSVVDLEAEVDSLTVRLSYTTKELAQQRSIADDLDAQLTEALDKVELQADRINLLSITVAAQPKTAPITKSVPAVVESAPIIESAPVITKPVPTIVKAIPVMTVVAQPKSTPAMVDDSLPIVEITAEQKAFYSKFQALPRAQRLSIIEFARPSFGHVGLTNIIEVRAAWHQAQAA